MFNHMGTQVQAQQQLQGFVQSPYIIESLTRLVTALGTASDSTLNQKVTKLAESFVDIIQDQIDVLLAHAKEASNG